MNTAVAIVHRGAVTMLPAETYMNAYPGQNWMLRTQGHWQVPLSPYDVPHVDSSSCASAPMAR